LAKNAVNGTNMKITQPSSECLTETSKIDPETLEQAIFVALMGNQQFNGLPLPCAVLSVRDDMVELGVSNKFHDAIVGNYCNYLAQREFDALMSKLLGNRRYRVVRAEEASIAADKRIEASKEVGAQKKAGMCNIVPFPVSEPNKKIRTELTIERHALFASNTFKGDFRLYEHEMLDLETGAPLTIRVEVGDPKGRVRGVLKQKHQETLYKLFEIWGDEGYKIFEYDGETFGTLTCTVYELVKRLRADDAAHHYDTVFGLLSEMAAIRVRIKKIAQEKGIGNTKDFSLLSFEWQAKDFDETTMRPKEDKESSKVCIRFSSFITESFLRKQIKQLMLKPYLDLKDRGRKGVAQLLYTMLDYELASKDEYHISLSKLADRLGATKYKFKSDQKRTIEPSLKSLNGTIILDGKYKLQITLRESNKKDDFVLDAKRVLV
jgi:hypothetical protein